MSNEDYTKERDYIMETARKNGYQEEMILNRIKKISGRKNRDLLTTLHQQMTLEPREHSRRIAITFDEKLTKGIKSTFKEIGVETVPTSRVFQLKNILKSTKDKKDIDETSGIYEISCPQCDMKYIGQTKRTIGIRFQEHMNEARTRKEGKKTGGNIASNVAKHVLETDHTIGRENVMVIKQINDPRKLDFQEMLTIKRQDPTRLMNENSGWGDTPLFRFLDV